MPALSFALSSTPDHLLGDGSGRHVNGIVEKRGDVIVRRRAAGLTQAFASGITAPRGLLDVAGSLYVVGATTVVKIAPNGTVTTLSGSIPGTDGVSLAYNNRVTSGAYTRDVVAVRETGGAYLLADTGVVSYPDADLPAAANSVTFLGGYLLFTIADGRLFATGLNTTDIDPLSFATAESRPDNNVRGIVQGSTYFACGSNTIEPWLNQGYLQYPLGRATSVVPVGLKTAMAIAGFEDGWALNPIFVSSDGKVRELDGYDTRVLSTAPVDDFLAKSTVSTLEASVYTANGRAIWSISSDRGTWAYDATAGAWSERESVGAARWRACRTVLSNGRWLAGDLLSGNIVAIDPAARTELGSALAWTIESAPVKEFPLRAAIPAVFADFSLGLGDVTTPDPHVAVSWSHDGGATWRGPLQRQLGPVGQVVRPVRVNGLGLASHHGIRIRFSVTDPVDFSFMGASIPKPAGRTP